MVVNRAPTLFVAVTLTFSLCVTMSTSVVAAGTVITHYHNTWHGGTWRRYLDEMAAAYEKSHPGVDIQIVDVPGDQYLTKVTATVAAGVGPDVLEAYPDSAAPYLQRGLISMLDQWIAADRIDLKQFIPQVVQDFEWKGHVWSLPISTFPILTLYNENFINEAGLVEPYRLAQSWTWEKVIEYGRKLTINKNQDGRPERWGVKAYWSLNRWFIFVHQAGGALYDRPVDPTQSRFNTVPVRKALEWMRDLYATYRITPIDMVELPAENVAISLSDGPTTMRDERVLRGNQLRIPIGVAPMPMGPDNNGTALFANGFQIAAGARAADQAWDWITFLTLEKQNVLRFVQLTGRPPAAVNLLQEYAKLLPTGVRNGEVFAPISLYPRNVPDIVTPFSDQIAAAVDPLMLQVLRGETDPSVAQEKMHAAVSVILRQRR